MNNKQGKWAHDYNCCQVCRSTKYRHVKDGICRRCYDRGRKRRLKQTPITFTVGVDPKVFDNLRVKVWF